MNKLRVELGSGDLSVGSSRFVYPGVPKVRPGTGPAALGLKGRLNIALPVPGLPG